jgi:hypothetical protein
MQRERQGHAAAPPAGTAARSCAKKCRNKKSKSARRRCRKRCQPQTPECTTSADCPPNELCESGICIPIPDQCTVDSDCDACEQCDAGVCRATCLPQQRCQNGQCVGSGSCRPTTCAEQDAACGTIDDGCRGTLDCGSCGGTTPICVENVCSPCSVTNPCPGGGCCLGSGACLANNAACDDGDLCTTGERCQNGTCGGGTTICTSPPVCRTTVGATCDAATGLCTYPPLGAGTACASVPCGTCDGAGTCVGCTAPLFCGGGGIPGVCGNTPGGTCAPGADYCASGDRSALACNANSDCLCDSTTEGTTVCRQFVVGTCESCMNSVSCGAGRVCVQPGPICYCGTIPGQNYCALLCPPGP